MDAADAGFVGREVAGRYRILAKLGEGVMGAVYRAEQISPHRIVALKVLRVELSAEPGMVRRFHAEAELAARLSHPNTVTLFDFGQDATGALFIAMEYLEGRSLRELLLREGPLEPGRALAICEQLCASLGDAHSHGMVHRDLKPDNVMLVERGWQTDLVRVLDFGIAKLRDEQGDVTEHPMTRAGYLLGTPQYMAPEQIRGEKVDPRTDIYSLGAMLYEMVTGRLPFEAPSLMGVLSAHLSETPVPPSERRPDLRIAPGLNQLVMDALHKDSQRRPPTMDAFADRLARLVMEVGPRIGWPPRSPTPGKMALGSTRTGTGYPPLPALSDSPPPGVPLLRTPVPAPNPSLRPRSGSSPTRQPHTPPADAGAHPWPAAADCSPPAAGQHPWPARSAQPPSGQVALSSPAPASMQDSLGAPAGERVAIPGGAPDSAPSVPGRLGLWIGLGLVIACAIGLAIFLAMRGQVFGP